MVLRHLSVAFAWTILIFIMYAIHGDDVPDNDLWDMFSLDKIGHFFLFIMLTHHYCVGFRKQNRRGKLRQNAMWYAVGISVGLGIVLELIQGTIFASRTTEVLDILANVAGGFTGILFFRLVYGRSLSKP